MTTIGAPDGASIGISAPGGNTGTFVMEGADIGIDVPDERPIADAAGADDWAAAGAREPAVAPEFRLAALVDPAGGNVVPNELAAGTLGFTLAVEGAVLGLVASIGAGA